MRIRPIQTVIQPQFVLEGAGVRLRRSIATRQIDYVDPFLLFDHFGSDDPADYIKGFPMHPHRGIETVTYMLSGSVRHKDSIGNAGSIGAGDVQWMTSGRGIMHEEMPTPVEGKMEGFQLWVNLPAKLKMSKPRYQEFASSKIPEYRKEDGTRVRIIAGMVEGIRGAVTDIAADPTYIDVHQPADTRFDHPVPTGHASLLYLFEGEAWIGEASKGSAVASTQMVVLGDGDVVQVTTSEQAARFLLISGKPLNESVARYGPFVMNTEEEITQALEDIRRGTFVG
jgi:redox-sensitive bicupin YhaK (pirin superfamily)